LESLHQDEVKALRINPVKGVGSLPDELEDMWHLESVPWEDTGFYYETEEGVLPPGKHPLHEAGAYYIQEPSAMYPVSLLGPKENERVLDLCASPGGKSTQIVSYMGNTGLLVSNEIIRSRALTLSSNIERMGSKNTVVTNMEPVRLSAALPAFFDRVLVDAPCSGEGMMRRGDAARENWSVENVLMCASRQKEILEEAAKCVRPGGKLVYSTCTFSKEEDEDNVQGFLLEHSDFELIKEEKLYPHVIRGEGHFAALFERKGNADSRIDYRCKKNAGSPAGLKAALDFLEDFLTGDAFARMDSGRIICFKDSLYLMPEGLSDIKGLNVIRPGLCLGCMKKDRFEPSHSLAMALLPEDAKNVFVLDPGGPEAAAYLSGVSLNLQDTRSGDIADGWCLVTMGKVSAGLGKKTGGTIKNHYPKGLRRIKHDDLSGTHLQNIQRSDSP
ncbi:MAG: RsmF rRNA methyltransferase first C-terminal domain-containing protein, partial [Lachnospiraceae bacterium]|nr:RsmF rRNA methyltransferase first C-terminal domain-containing protein [Lachnospiraceae bacterium]